MNTLTAIQERRSIKQFDPNHNMTEDEIKTLMEHTLLSPTSFNMQNWRFVLVTNQAQKERLKEAAWNQAQVSDASLVVLLCADLKAHTQAERYWVNAPQSAQDMIIPMIHKFYEGKKQLQHDESLRSIGIAARPSCSPPKPSVTTPAHDRFDPENRSHYPTPARPPDRHDDHRRQSTQACKSSQWLHALWWSLL